jgi:hypothetical protein
MAETIFWWLFLFASACVFIFGYAMVEDLVRQWRSNRRTKTHRLTLQQSKTSAQTPEATDIRISPSTE